MAEFIQRVRDEKLIRDDSFAIQAYRDDRTLQITAQLTEFTTPAGADGFGTQVLDARDNSPLAPPRFGQSARLVSGLVAVTGIHSQPDLWVLRVRLDDKDDALRSAIIKVEEECLQHDSSG